MKYYKIILVFALIVFNTISYSQHVLHRHNNHILIDLDKSSGYTIDHIYNIYRSLNDTSILIGKAQVIEYRDSKCALQIISENQPIEIGDIIESTNKNKIDILFESYNKKINISERTRNRTLTYITGGSGLVATVMGLVFYSQAAKHYDDYKSATTPDQASLAFDRAERWNNFSKISYGVGGGLIVFALINEFIKPNSTQDKMVTLNPNFINKSVTLAINF